MRASRFVEHLLAGTVLAAIAVSAAHANASDTATVAWLRDGKVEMRTLTRGAAAGALPANGDIKVPLGSLWKLFTYVHLAETREDEPAYTCAQKPVVPQDDRYCCAPGESVGRDQALARSCAPYFSPARLGIAQEKWRAQWRAYTSASWLLDINRLQPATEVSVADLLAALATIPERARTQARAALLETGIKGYGRDVWTMLGTGIRYKTYSWHLSDGGAFGGAAGWLADGTPFWFGARGSSKSALTAWAAQLTATLPAPDGRGAMQAASEANCVDVDFFTRYPLHAVWKADENAQVGAGNLNGRYRLEFKNGNRLGISARGDLSLARGADNAPILIGRFTLNEYVARVVDREGNARHTQAARALAIAARSYLLQNAHFQAGCWRIADSSRTQRVSPNPPSASALAAAWFTDEIILTGTPVQYHRDNPGSNRLAWRDAVAHDEQGWNFERILSAAYPTAGIGTLSGREDCKRLPEAEAWLLRAAQTWTSRLRREPGFEVLETPARICALADGHPYSDQQRLRIYIRGWRSLDERITLAHEYLHLAFRFHPNGANEDFIERLARRLIEG